MDFNKDYYSILGIPENATYDEIKKAYRAKVKIWHPDKNHTNKKYAEERLKDLNEAYEVLINTQKRKIYDSYTSGSREKSKYDYKYYTNKENYTNTTNFSYNYKKDSNNTYKNKNANDKNYSNTNYTNNNNTKDKYENSKGKMHFIKKIILILLDIILLCSIVYSFVSLLIFKNIIFFLLFFTVLPSILGKIYNKLYLK